MPKGIILLGPSGSGKPRLESLSPEGLESLFWTLTIISGERIRQSRTPSCTPGQRKSNGSWTRWKNRENLSWPVP